MTEIAIFSPYDDISSDGTAKIWRMNKDGDLNEQFNCLCIYEMLTAKELFKIFINDNIFMEIESERFHKFCTKVETK